MYQDCGWDMCYACGHGVPILRARPKDRLWLVRLVRVVIVIVWWLVVFEWVMIIVRKVAYHEARQTAIWTAIKPPREVKWR